MLYYGATYALSTVLPTFLTLATPNRHGVITGHQNIESEGQDTSQAVRIAVFSGFVEGPGRYADK